jgi:hypothetical protein
MQHHPNLETTVKAVLPDLQLVAMGSKGRVRIVSPLINFSCSASPKIASGPTILKLAAVLVLVERGNQDRGGLSVFLP